MEIIKSNYVSFEEYKEIVEKYVKSDCREINFQNRVVLQLLEKIFINDSSIYIVDVSSQYKNKEVTDYHERKHYAWKHTPDLLIVKDWKYNNIGKSEEDYLAVVEIKSPVLDPINKYKSHTFDEVDEYRKNRKVILTDCYEWIFYNSEGELEHFVLHDHIDWIMQEKNNPDFIVQEFGFNKTRKESVKWNDLIRYIEKFIL